MTDTYLVSSSNLNATQIVWSGDGPTLIVNTSLTVIIQVGDTNGIQAADATGIAPVNPNGSLVVNGENDVYACVAAGQSAVVATYTGGLSTFLGLTQAMGQLAIPAISSPNYVTGVSGWTIEKNGNAEFNNLTIRGTFQGVDFIINSVGLFFYNPTEAFGNLVLSISPNGGIGPFGETILDGIRIISGTAYQQLHINAVYGAPAQELVTGVVSEAQHAAIYALAAAVGLPNESAVLNLFGPGSSADNTQAYIALASNTANNANIAAGILNIAVSGITQRVAYWTANGVSFVTPGGTIWGPTLSQGDATLATASAVTFQNLTKVWSIPAGEIKNVNTGYRITCSGTIVMGAAVQVVTFCLNAFSNTTIQLPIGGAEFLANTTYWYRAQGEVLFNPIGAVGQFLGGLSVDLGVSAANQATVAGAAQTAGGFAAEGVAAGVNTTVAGNIALQAKVGVAGPTVNGRYSVLERIVA
jgi:hypothetical protein